VIARNHHYVPRFIMRHFLSDERKEQVTVYDKTTDKQFSTAIENIMAERDFHALSFGDYIVSFESIATHIENISIPAYEKVIAERRLDGSPEQKAALAFLIAFQFLRTKAHRNMQQELEGLLRAKLESEGSRLEDLQNYTPLKPDDLKKSHARAFREDTGEYAHIIAGKDFVLQAAAPDRTFYLGDHPVVLNNMRDHGPYGNIGLAVEGIEIYMPLASDLMLCAFCPTIVQTARAKLEHAKRTNQSDALREMMAGRITAQQMKESLDELKPLYAPSEQFLAALQEGTPASAVDTNMDYFNSLQMRHAVRFVIAADGNFALAKDINKRFPGDKGGMRFSM
jgi:hypothetical protein